jgi:hypothetical protein
MRICPPHDLYGTQDLVYSARVKQTLVQVLCAAVVTEVDSDRNTLPGQQARAEVQHISRIRAAFPTVQYDNDSLRRIWWNIDLCQQPDTAIAMKQLSARVFDKISSKVLQRDTAQAGSAQDRL